VKAVHVVVPDGIDDPGRPSGGNVYDRRLIDCLASAGWVVDVHPVAGSWPEAGPAARERLRLVLAEMAEETVVLVDGLIASAAPDVLVPESRRLRVVVLVHLPLGGRDDLGATTLEGRVLSAAEAVVTTSRWTRDRVLELYALPPQRVHVASPGAARSAAVRGTPQGRQLLCVAALTRDKGHDVLLAALGKVSDLEWNLVCVGSRDVDQAYAAELAVLAEELGIGGRVWFAGTQSGPRLATSYAAADVVVLPTRIESYGMVLTEALARGIPVIASAVGGVPEALGTMSQEEGPDLRVPGLLVPAGDAGALADALRRWLEVPELRLTLRKNALERRASLTGWDVTADRVARVLTGVRS
jgi:glycosyltransferase involved in cell wall biosynthesis